MRIAMALIVILMTTVGASAHSGGTDKNGCHYDRKNGGWHCH